MTGKAPATLSDAASRWVERLAEGGLAARIEALLSNGLRASVTGDGRSCRVNLYFSARKGFSVVYAGGDRCLAEEAAAACEVRRLAGPWPRLGSDEAGKGDYLGPLVVAAAWLDRESAEELSREGLRDSKTLGDALVMRLDGMMNSMAGVELERVVIAPANYNSWLEHRPAPRSNSLDMLAEAHGLAINAISGRMGAPGLVVIDKFASDARIEAHLVPGLNLRIRTHAEDDPAVAAASVAARAEYLRWLDSRSGELGIRLTPGASSGADEAARKVVERYGEQALKEIAKLHFRNTLKVLSPPAP